MFFGVGLDAATRDLLAAHLNAHVPEGLPGKVVPPSNWHLTLRFLGPTSELQSNRLVYELGESLGEGPFVLRFGGLGAFPRPQRATVLWFGIDEGADDLAGVANVCEAAAVAAGFPAEGRPFHPHLTMSRIRPPVDVQPLVEDTPPFAVKMSVAAVTLFESHPGRGGPRYKAIDQVEI
jgi:2'-5' RNA ligase